jgi:hypothetical protein
LPEDASRQIHAYLREPQFLEILTNLRSMWHRLQHGLESRFDPAAHLRACEEHLEYDWHYGQALIEVALSRQDFAAGERFIEGSLSSLLRWSEQEPWRPEKFLLPESRYYQLLEESQAKLELLDQWEETAARLGKRERVAGLRFQRVILQSPEDCPSRIRSSSGSSAPFAGSIWTLFFSGMAVTWVKNFYYDYRVHQGLDGDTPGERNDAQRPARPASFENYTWQSHCNGLFDLPIAA